jgi:hypothetical protein
VRVNNGLRRPALKAGRTRVVPCPACRQPALFSPDNPSRPFCSARCKSLDLGAWSSEDYRVPAQPEPGEPPESHADAD